MNQKNGVVRTSLAVVALVASGGLAAQTLRITAANSSAGNAVYDVLFDPVAGTTLLNSDGGTLRSVHAVAFVPGTASGVDLIVADKDGGTILRYVAPHGTPPQPGVVVWSAASNIPGPSHPDGLSVDAAGNLYVTTDDPKPSVWVLRASASAAGGFQAPTLLDYRFAGHAIESLADTVVVPATLSATVTAKLASSGIHAGDLLVLVDDSDSDRCGADDRVAVLDYTAGSLATFLANPAQPIAPPLVALRERQLPDSAHHRSAPVTGLDIWPTDGSLLLSGATGTILQYSLSAASYGSALWTNSYATTFATISCGYPSSCPLGKLKTGTQGDTAYGFVAQSTGAYSGNILQFAVPLATPTPSTGFRFTAATAVVPTAASTTADSTTGSPAGLAVAPQAVVITPAATCVDAAGCNPTGGLTGVIVPGPAGVGPQGVHGNIVQQSCLLTDTRLQPNGSCPGNLNIAQQCPGFPANFIPPTICGASGPSHNQFAIIHSIANGVDDVPGILIQSEENPSGIIPGATDEACNSDQVLGWSPRLGSDEGVVPEGAAVLDMTTFCDKSGSTTRGNSIWAVGGKLSTAVTASTHSLVGFANGKLVNLGKTVGSANIARPVKEVLGVCLITSAILLDTGRYACAARNVWACDQLVAKTANSFGSSPDNPNPYGDVRGRLGNLFYTINTRILKNAPNPAWPLTVPPPRCY